MSGTTRFGVDYAKRASNCKRCKQPLEKSKLRVAKITKNPFDTDDSDMKQYFHAKCIFESFERTRAGTKIVETPADLENWSDLTEEDKKDLLDKMKKLEEFVEAKAKKGGKGGTGSKKKESPAPAAKRNMTPPKKEQNPKSIEEALKSPSKSGADSKKGSKTEESDNDETSDAPKKNSDDDSLAAFCNLCEKIARDSKYNAKTAIIQRFIDPKYGGTSGKGYIGDLHILCKLLIPKADHRVYNLKEKALIKLFSSIFETDAEDMMDHFNSCGEVAETVQVYFEKKSKARRPQSTSSLKIQDVDKWLTELTEITKEDDQLRHLKQIVKKATGKDLLYIIRMIKKDIRINAGAKHVMEALAPNAYEAFQASRNLKDVIDKILTRKEEGGGKMTKQLSIGINIGTPVLPMLAEACRSVDFAMKRCPNGMYAEIKYDGERVQVHKNGNKFTYFSRSLKPVQGHKVEQFEHYIPKAFPGGGDLILDAEVLLIDVKTQKPLPFGTLGKHKKEKFSDANVCLFIFDCLMLKGQSLMTKPIKERRKILETSMEEVENRVHFSGKEYINHGDKAKLRAMIQRAIDEGLEGLVLKDMHGIYEPGKRHWLKVKKDYLNEGSMADTADLIVLGGYYGTGNKGGILSVFLMGVYDKKSGKYCTVTKVGNGHDDRALEQINKELQDGMKKISRDACQLPTWIKCSNALTPDWIMTDPKKAPVWEITGAEFSKSDHHSANGISIRFPRVTKVRNDKDWEGATNLDELAKLYSTSKETQDFNSPSKLNKTGDGEGEEDVDVVVPLPGFGIRQTSKASDVMESDESPSKKPSPKKKSEEKKKDRSDEKRKRKAEEDSGSDDHDEEERKPSPTKIHKAVQKQKAVCKYGHKCYQTNEDHLKRFSHPSPADDNKSDKANTNTITTTSGDNIFTGVKIFLASHLKDASKLKKYIAYADGEIVDAEEDADFKIGDDELDVKMDVGGRLVKPDWVWDSIKKKKVQPADDYQSF